MSITDRIICLTEESVETLYLLGKERSIVGVSEYVERPVEATLLPKVTQFVRSNIEEIVNLRPTLVLGFSDIQKDIASQLIGRGLNVFVTNQRTLPEILSYIEMLGRLVGEESKARMITQDFRTKIDLMKRKSSSLPKRPRVYFEEWDHPRLSGITWVSELIEICGGENIFREKSGALARDREVTDELIIEKSPDIIFGCWCGKPVKTEKISGRKGYETIPAVKKDFIWELPPAIFLQPGPALFLDGLDQMFSYIRKAALDVS
jgi:iron complex transport system substrate-binding protein